METPSVEELTIRNLSIKIANLESDNARMMAMLQIQQQQSADSQEGDDGDELEDTVQS